MRIAYLSDSELPSKRANSVHVMHMCNAFSKLGHEVWLFGLKGGKVSLKEIRLWYGVGDFGLKLTSLRIPKLTLWWHALHMLRGVRKLKSDVIFGRSLFGCYVLAKHGFKVCLETHDPINVLTKQQHAIFIKLLKSPNLIGIVVISKALKEIILSQTTLIKEDRILVAHDGATIQNFTDSDLASYPWPTSKNERLQIGYVGTISQGRGIELIIELSKKLSHLDFHIIGGRKEDLQKIGLEANGVSENLFFHGFVSPKEATLARKRCDILLAPYQENVTLKSGKNTAKYMSPLKVFEYMEAGKAIIASDLPVLREVLTDGDNCILINPKSTPDWVKLVETVSADNALRQALGRKAYQSLLMNYTWEKRSERILTFINEQLEKQ
jgi:glycosyltransferase involved in cell wall biosynthesis